MASFDDGRNETGDDDESLRINHGRAARPATTDAFDVDRLLLRHHSEPYTQRGAAVRAHEREPAVDLRPRPTEQQAKGNEWPKHQQAGIPRVAEHQGPDRHDHHELARGAYHQKCEHHRCGPALLALDPRQLEQWQLAPSQLRVATHVGGLAQRCEQVGPIRLWRRVRRHDVKPLYVRGGAHVTPDHVGSITPPQPATENPSPHPPPYPRSLSLACAVGRVRNVVEVKPDELPADGGVQEAEVIEVPALLLEAGLEG